MDRRILDADLLYGTFTDQLLGINMSVVAKSRNRDGKDRQRQSESSHWDAQSERQKSRTCQQSNDSAGRPFVFVDSKGKVNNVRPIYIHTLCRVAQHVTGLF